LRPTFLKPETKIYLASKSRRRQELLRQIGVSFAVLAADVPEHHRENEPPADYVRRLARAKAGAAMETVRENGLPVRPILAADTCVVQGDVIVGKPHDRRHGEQILTALAGHTHEVLTAVHVLYGRNDYVAFSSSRVTFGPLSAAEIARYWQTGEPHDKAGAYAIQGRAGAFVARIEGSYSGVVGLPLFEVVQILKKIGVAVL